MEIRNETTLNDIIVEAKYNANKHGWKILWNKNVIDKKVLSIGDALSLCHSELSEALEDYRDDNKEHFKEEIADEFIRLCHLCGDLDIDIEEEIHKKMLKNRNRPLNHGRVNY